MIIPPYFEQALRETRSFWDDAILNDDAWRLRQGYFGSRQRPHAARGVMLLLGGRSGLEAKLATMANPETRLFVVEPQEERRERTAYAASGNVDFASKLKEFLDGDLPEIVDFVRIDREFFSPEILHELLARRTVRHVCGAVPPGVVDALALHRLCRQHNVSFHFYIEEIDRSISSGGHSAPEYEVSVVVPAYKVEEWLDQCLSSLSEQTIIKLEVIVVDDGSPDASGKIADRWAEKDPVRFKVIHKENGGCASARMAGLQFARGEFVGFVDGDDWVEPPMFEELYRAAVFYQAEIAQCGFYEIFSDGSRVDYPTAFGGDGPNGTSGLVRDPMVLLHAPPGVWRRIYKRDFALQEKLEFPEHIKRFDDVVFNFLALSRASQVAIIPDCYYAYRQGRPGQDIGARDERLFVHFDIFDWLSARVAPWANPRVRYGLAVVETGSHLWALGRIESAFKRTYKKKVLERYKAYSAHLPIIGRMRTFRAIMRA